MRPERLGVAQALSRRAPTSLSMSLNTVTSCPASSEKHASFRTASCWSSRMVIRMFANFTVEKELPQAAARLRRSSGWYGLGSLAGEAPTVPAKESASSALAEVVRRG